ncbi:arginine deiminase family protein [Acidianus brierleyi]|uniref:Amidinotransferase n=1 Tax=Acidianus brierleyi TaxID=41673 RepID=A0A2U9IGC6_9CREN|nr:arginine deiminase family protein [Acidianus brierleyi]AWR95069.1 amidinotransferase [Acidianus brierleyi]
MFTIKAEWDRLRGVLVHEPGIEMFYGVLDPESFLYMRRFNLQRALLEHKKMQDTLKELGVTVYRLKDVILDKANSDQKIMDYLKKLALESIRFEGDGELEKQLQDFEEDINKLDPESLFNIVLLKPTVITHKALGTSESTPRIINEEPLANLYFTRDQTIVTDEGIVLGRMSKRIRRRETILLKLAIESLSENIIKEISEPAFAEGGDYMPFKNFAIFGTGDRTTIAGAIQVSDALNFNEIVIAYNPVIQANDYMLSMHLDMYLNTPMEGIIVSNKKILQSTRADVYEKKEGKYVLKERTNLLDFFIKKRFDIIDITLLEQISYSTNFLTIKNGQIVTLDSEKNSKYVLEYVNSRGYMDLSNEINLEYTKLKEDKRFFPRKKEIDDFGIDFVIADVGELTGGFGGIHCMTMSLYRN